MTRLEPLVLQYRLDGDLLLGLFGSVVVLPRYRSQRYNHKNVTDIPSILAAKTTPKLPLPTTLQLVYEIVTSWPVFPDCAFTVTTLFGSSASPVSRSPKLKRSYSRDTLTPFTRPVDMLHQE